MERVEDAVRIGQNAVRIARQSIIAGLVLSGTAMVVAALGFIPPTAGALILLPSLLYVGSAREAWESSIRPVRFR